MANVVHADTRKAASLFVDADGSLITSPGLLAVSRGHIDGLRTVFRDGMNPNVAAGATEALTYSGVFNWLTAATTIRVKAGGNAADDAAGANARTITVSGLSATGAEISETITLAGASASAPTTAAFWRVFDAHVATVGVYGNTNLGDIVIENSAGGTDLMTIPATFGEAKWGWWTVPLGYTAYFLGFNASVATNKPADIHLFIRQNVLPVGAPYYAPRMVMHLAGLSGHAVIDLKTFPAFPALTDMWIDVHGFIGSDSAASCLGEFILVPTP